MPETLTLDIDGDGIATLTLQRPDKLNAFNRDMLAEMIAAFDAMDADDSVRAIIVTGAGRAFCAGADLSEGAATFDYAERTGWNGAASPIGQDGAVDYAHPAVRDGGGMLALRIFASRKPVIAAINGPAVGVGATMTLAMDFRLASENARFGFVFARRGIVPEATSTWFLPRIVGMSQAMEWTYSGRVFDAAEAFGGGLVRSIHAADALLAEARAFALSLVGESSAVSIALTRRMLLAGAGAAHPMEAHRIESRAIWARGASADAREGVESFLAKRDATYPDSVAAIWPTVADWFDDPPYE